MYDRKISMPNIVLNNQLMIMFQYSNPIANSHSINMAGSYGGLPHVITANSESSMSDSDTEVIIVKPSLFITE